MTASIISRAFQARSPVLGFQNARGWLLPFAAEVVMREFGALLMGVREVSPR
jgi:hypothetical protein